MSLAVATEPPASVPPSSVRNGTSYPAEPHKFTVEEYFALEAASEIRYEYDEGVLIPMARTTAPHNRIAGNFFVAFDRAFEDRSCEVYIETIGFRVSSVKYRYPDVMAMCDVPAFDDNKPPCLLNPAVIVEILSNSTQETDKGKKIEEYLNFSSVTDYLLVEQERVNVVHWSRQKGDQWNMNEYNDFSDSLSITSIGVTMTLKEIYRRIQFTSSEENAS